MARRLHKTPLDYLVIALSPALIMTLVGSLVLFLIQVFYRGEFQGRLEYIFVLFVIGTTLIGRISIEDGRERAALFAVPMAIAILLAVYRFVEFQGSLLAWSVLINFALVVVVWWATDKLTWDCTLIDEREEDGGEGLLETVGLDRSNRAAVQQEIAPASAPTESATPSPGRWQRFVERRRRPHAPGVWVVYFSLAALPLFGIGQLFLPADDVPIRRYAFGLLWVYTASGLGLLLSTAFLGLRRYLRQRRLEMPMAIVSLWLGVGAVLLLSVMMAALLLPRPNAEYAISQPPFLAGMPDKNRKSSPVAVGRDGVKEEQAARKTPSPGGKDKVDSDKAKETGGEKDSKDAKGSSPGDKDKSDGGKGKSSDDKNKASDDKQKQSGDNDRKTPDGGGSSSPQRQPESQPQRPEGERRLPGEVTRTPMLSPERFRELTDLIPALGKWILYGIFAIVIAWVLWAKRAELLTGLSRLIQQLLDLWRNLFHWKTRETEVDDEESAKPVHRPRFADFTDPFASGAAPRYRPAELVRYTFEALEAWARDNGHPRLSDQTPHEFARQLADFAAPLAEDVRVLAEMYCQVAYAAWTPSAAGVMRLSQLWRKMRESAAAAQPES